MKCRFCGTDNNDNAAFCKQCGNELNTNRCPHCGKEIDVNNVIYCKYCGENIAGGNTIIFSGGISATKTPDSSVEPVIKSVEPVIPPVEPIRQVKPVIPPVEPVIRPVEPAAVPIESAFQQTEYTEFERDINNGYASNFYNQKERVAPGGQVMNDYVDNRQIPGKGSAIASMVLGIVSLVFWFMGSLAIISTILGIIGLCLSIKSKKQGYVGGMRTAGFVCSLIALIGGLVIFLIAVIAVGAFVTML